jgi:hypothetical protein
MVKQSSTVASMALPELSDITRPVRQASPSPVTSKTTNTPEPAGIMVPDKLNPRTTAALDEIINPAASAAPPEALTTSTPSTLNWKPAIGVSVLYKISIVSASIIELVNIVISVIIAAFSFIELFLTREKVII